MRKNDLIQTEQSVLRILAIDGNRVLVIDCLKRNMPKWYPVERVSGNTITEQEFKTIPWELYGDMLLIDSVISEQPVWVGFDEYGQLNTDKGFDRTHGLNIYLNELSVILIRAFPKQKGTTYQ